MSYGLQLLAGNGQEVVGPSRMPMRLLDMRDVPDDRVKQNWGQLLTFNLTVPKGVQGIGDLQVIVKPLTEGAVYRYETWFIGYPPWIPTSFEETHQWVREFYEMYGWDEWIGEPTDAEVQEWWDYFQANPEALVSSLEVYITTSSGAIFEVYLYAQGEGSFRKASPEDKEFGLEVFNEKGGIIFDSYSPILEISEVTSRTITSKSWTNIATTEGLLYLSDCGSSYNTVGSGGGSWGALQFRRVGNTYQSRTAQYWTPEWIENVYPGPRRSFQVGKVRDPFRL